MLLSSRQELMQSLHLLRWQVKEPFNDLTIQYQTAIQQRDTVGTTAQLDMHNLRHEVRLSQEPASFMISERQASSSHMGDPLSHSLQVGQTHAERSHRRSREREGRPHAESEETPRSVLIPIPATVNRFATFLPDFSSKASNNPSRVRRDRESVPSPYLRPNFFT